MLYLYLEACVGTHHVTHHLGPVRLGQREGPRGGLQEEECNIGNKTEESLTSFGRVLRSLWEKAAAPALV